LDSHRNVDGRFNAHPWASKQEQKAKASFFNPRNIDVSLPLHCSRRPNNNPKQANQGLLFDQKAIDGIASLVSTRVD